MVVLHFKQQLKQSKTNTQRSNIVNTWWEKQEGLERLAKVFKETENEYIIEKEERHTPKPPMSPFDSNAKKDKNGKEIK